jgi:hypothetical protein
VNRVGFAACGANMRSHAMRFPFLVAMVCCFSLLSFLSPTLCTVPLLCVSALLQ